MPLSGADAFLFAALALLVASVCMGKLQSVWVLIVGAWGPRAGAGSHDGVQLSCPVLTRPRAGCLNPLSRQLSAWGERCPCPRKSFHGVATHCNEAAVWSA